MLGFYIHVQPCIGTFERHKMNFWCFGLISFESFKCIKLKNNSLEMTYKRHCLDHVYVLNCGMVFLFSVLFCVGFFVCLVFQHFPKINL